MVSRHHVIVGDGPTAAAFARNVELVAGDQLTIVGANANQFGRGLAYGDAGEGRAWRDAYLLNSPSGATSDEFVDWFGVNWDAIRLRLSGQVPDWLTTNADHIAALDFGAMFAPRSIFGDFLAERADADLAALHERGIKIERRTAIATSIAQQLGRFRVTLNQGTALLADSVDVATGGAGNQRFGTDTSGHAFAQLYGNEAEIAQVIGRENRAVTVLGANAAMLDVLRFMQSIMPESEIRLGVISPTGQLPEPLTFTRPRKPAVKPDLPDAPYATAQAFLNAVDRDIVSHRAKCATMAELRSGFYDHLNSTGLVEMISDTSERRKVRNALEQRFRRGNTDSIEDFHRLHDAGQIEVIKGRVKRVYARGPYQNDVKIVTVDGEEQEATVPIVINTAGTGGQFSFDLLTTEMIRNGWLRFDNEKNGLRVGAKLETEVAGVRYLSPMVTEIGTEILPFPLYDITGLNRYVDKSRKMASA